MKIRKSFPTSLVILALTSSAFPASADSVVNVELREKSGDLVEGLGMGMHGDMAMATMGMTIDVASVPAGKVTFKVTNAAAESYHQLLVLPIANRDVVLPYLADGSMVDVENLGVLGEGVTLKGHTSDSLTLELVPGQYALFCNLAGHFMTGMWTTLEVTP